MDNHNQNGSETFRYTYSAKEQEELKRIRQKYMPEEEDNMSRLRRLDAAVTRKATTAALTVGILGALLLGLGMSCAMVWMGMWFIPGIAIGLAGIALVSTAYPVYQHTIRRERKKIAPEIMRLTDELLK